MFAHDQGWLRRMREAVLSGLTAEAAVERVQSDNRARMLRQTDPYLRDRLHDLDDLANRLLHRLVGRDLVARARLAAGQRHHRRPLHGPGGAPRLRPLAPARPRPGGGRADEPHRHRRPGARHPGGRRGRERHLARRAGRRHHRRRRRRRRPDPAAPGRRGRLCGEGAPARPPAGAVPRACATCRPSPGTGSRSTCSSMPGSSSTCPISTRPAPPGSACSAPSCSSWSPSAMPSAGEQQALYKAVLRRRRRPAGHLPHPRHRRRQDPALHAGRSRRRTRRSAGAPSASASTGRRCCAPRCARSSRRPAGGRCKIMFPMVATCDEFARAKAIVEREKRHLARHGHALPTRARARRHGGGALAAVPDRRDLPRGATSSRSARTT